MKVEIDSNSGFCFGVVYAIEMAEDYLNESGPLFCLGDIVHNDKEVQRLEAKGLKIIDHEDLKELKDTTVLIRAHGEPPETYKIALQNNIELPALALHFVMQSSCIDKVVVGACNMKEIQSTFNYLSDTNFNLNQLLRTYQNSI
jgi:4-hydroxy-3-methylbut-2-enyl diphosphate reductase IspH